MVVTWPRGSADVSNSRAPPSLSCSSASSHSWGTCQSEPLWPPPKIDGMPCLSPAPPSRQAQWPHVSPWQPPPQALPLVYFCADELWQTLLVWLLCFSKLLHHLLEYRSSWWLRSFQAKGAINNLLAFVLKKFVNGFKSPELHQYLQQKKQQYVWWFQHSVPVQTLPHRNLVQTPTLTNWELGKYREEHTGEEWGSPEERNRTRSIDCNQPILISSTWKSKQHKTGGDKRIYIENCKSALAAFVWLRHITSRKLQISLKIHFFSLCNCT